MLKRYLLVAGWLTVGSAFSGYLSSAAFAQDNVSNGVVKIGVLTDMSGVTSDISGSGSVTAARMAIEDFGGEVLGKPIQLVNADHHHKPALGSSIARKWIDREQVDLITGLTNSAVTIAVQGIASQKHTISMAVGAGSTALTNKYCSKYGIQYAYNTRALAVGTATAVVKQGGKTWFFITADYAFGHSLQKNTSAVVQALGGKVLGAAQHPLSTADFASYLIQAQSSGAQVIALANAGGDTVNAIKQANAFNITANQRLVAMLMFITDVKALGLETAQRLNFTVAWYWNQNDKTRAWSKRFYKKQGAMPTYLQAGVYSAVLSYLKAVKQAGTDDADAVRQTLGNMTINDVFVQGGDIFSNGLMVHDMYLVEVKAPAESQAPWDLLKVIQRIPSEKAFAPTQSTCDLANP